PTRPVRVRARPAGGTLRRVVVTRPPRSSAARRCEEALACTTPLATPVAAIRRGSRLMERDRLLRADHEVARRSDFHVGVRQFEAVPLTATQLSGRVLVGTALNPLR